MDPNGGIDRLSIISNEIAQVEAAKLYWEHRLALFWEHLPAIDPEMIADAMQQIRDRIRGLEDRRRALVQEQQALIVQAAINRANGGGD